MLNLTGIRTRIGRLRARQEERRLYERLLSLDDHLLADMGLSRRGLEALAGLRLGA